MTTAENTTETATHGVTLSDAAAIKAKALLDQEGRDDMHLRIAVQPGGCAGLRYQLFFDERTLDGDLFRDFNGLRVAVSVVFSAVVMVLPRPFDFSLPVDNRDRPRFLPSMVAHVTRGEVLPPPLCALTCSTARTRAWPGR